MNSAENRIEDPPEKDPPEAPEDVTAASSSASPRIGLYLALAVAIIVLDRLTKDAIASGMRLYETRVIVPDLFNLVHTRNTGIAFSLFSDSSPFVKGVILPVVSTVAVMGIAYLFWRSGALERQTRLGLTLILAGAAGNLYDRFAYGYVTDFLDVYLGSHHWPAFNVADSSITIGAGLLLLDSFRRAPDPEAGPESNPESEAA